MEHAEGGEAGPLPDGSPRNVILSALSFNARCRARAASESVFSGFLCGPESARAMAMATAWSCIRWSVTGC